MTTSTQFQKTDIKDTCTVCMCVCF